MQFLLLSQCFPLLVIGYPSEKNMFKVVCCRIVVWGKGLKQTAFWKHSNKRRNCTERAISPFVTMFSTFSHRLSIWQNTFKVVCCRIAVWGKGLKQTAFWKHSDKRRNCTERAISPFVTMFSTFSHRLSIWKKYVQSRLLQNCRMRERVKADGVLKT